VAKSCITVCFTYSLRIANDFLNTDISQGSVAIHLVLGGVFKYSFVTNFLLNLTLKEFRKSLIFGEVIGKSLVSCFLRLKHDLVSRPLDSIERIRLPIRL